MNRRRIALSLLLAILASSVTWSDTIVLKNGAEFHGKVRKVDDDTYTLSLPKGRISFTQREIAEIRFDDNRFAANNWTLRDTTKSAKVAEPVSTTELPLDREEIARYERLMRSLGELDEEDEDSGFSEERQRIVSALGAMGSRAAPYLERSLKRGEANVAPYVLAALVEAAPQRGAKTAGNLAVNDANSDVRLMAVTLLADLNAAAYIDTFRRATEDSQGDIRAEAVRGLEMSASIDAVPTLIESLDDSLRAVQVAAEQALKECTDEDLSGKQAWTDWYAQYTEASAQSIDQE